MKIAFSILLALSSCAPSSDNPSNPTGTQSAVSYSSCEGLPSGTPTPKNSCPSTVGTWDNFVTETVPSVGVILKYELYCGGSHVDHPVSQAGYDLNIPTEMVSSNDFKIGEDCASGSYIKPTGEKVFDIWRLAK